MIVEAHPVGSNDWTTLPDENGHTIDLRRSVLRDRLALGPPVHRPLPDGRRRSNTPEVEDCYGTGTTGEWNGATGNSGGYQTWDVDLSAYAGQQVEISISYVQDFAVDGLGVFLDDVAVTEDGTVTDQTSFETDLGGFTAGPAPAGSEAATQRRVDATAVARLGRRARRRHRGHAHVRASASKGSAGVAAQNAAMASAMVHLGVLPTGRPAGRPGPRPAGRRRPACRGRPTRRRPRSASEPEKKSSSTKAKFKFSSDEAGLDLRVQARQEGLEGLRLAEEVQQPRRGQAPVQGPRHRHSREHGSLAGEVPLAGRIRVGRAR